MRFLVALFLLFPLLANAGAFSAVRSNPTVTAGVSGSTPILQVAQPYTFTQTTAANVPVFGGAANAAQYSLGTGAGSSGAQIAQAALAVAGAGAAVFSSPVVGGVMAALTVGSAGYSLYQSLKAEGIVFKPDGTGTQANFGQFQYGGIWALV